MNKRLICLFVFAALIGLLEASAPLGLLYGPRYIAEVALIGVAGLLIKERQA